MPSAGPGEALVRVEAVGICASDLKCYHGAAKFWGDENRPAWAQTDVIPGHEFVGEVVGLDDEARGRWGIEVGDRVVAEQIVPCGKCRYCQRGQYWMCGPHEMFGFRRSNPGGMASYMVFRPEARVHKVSKDLPPAHAAFAEPLSCALHAVERAGITFDDVVVVAGCGPIGLGMIAGRQGQVPGQGRRPRHGAGEAGARQVVRGRPGREHRRGGPGRGRQGAHRRLRRRRLPRGHRAPLRRRPGAQPPAQAGHVRRVQRLQGRRHRRLVDHQRRQGARRARRPPRPALLAGRDPHDRVGRPADGQDLHPPAAPGQVPGGPRPGGRRASPRSRSR